jgi:hypothetical protein
VGGIAGLVGGLFGGAKKRKEELAKMGEAKAQLVEQFGSMDKLQHAAELAGVSIDMLFSTDNAKIFQGELDKVTGAIQEMQERVKTTIADIDTVMAKGGIIGADLWQRILPDAGAEEIKAKLAEVFQVSVDRSAEGFNKIATNFEILKAPLSELGPLVEGAFGGLLTAGASVPEALAAIAPGLEHLRGLAAASGEQPGGMLGQLLNWQGIVEQNKGLFELLSGVDDMLVGLANSGLLTQQSFSALGQTVSQAFGQLQAQGVAGATALQLMQPQLQKLWELEQQRGFALDANTQKLVNQAVQQGIVGPQMQSIEQKMLDVMLAIAQVLGADIPQSLLGLPTAAATAAGGLATAFAPGTVPNPIEAMKTSLDTLPTDADAMALRFKDAMANAVTDEDRAQIQLAYKTYLDEWGGFVGGMQQELNTLPGLASEKFAALAGIAGTELAKIPRTIGISLKLRNETGAEVPTLGGAWKIPAMASGGIVTRPTLGMIGEGGPEAVVPLDEYEGGGVTVRIDNVYGSVDADFAERLAKAVKLGGRARTAWEGALR